MKVELTFAEIQMATVIGVQRQIEDIKWENHGNYGAKKELAWQRHIEGALAECALAKFLDVYWSKGKWDIPDVGNVDVRVTHLPHGKLILHKEDKDDRKYYLLIGLNGIYEIKGYILGKDGKRPEFYYDPTKENRPAYFVPQDFLQEALPF
jgi:hypothetical protein